jgi:hypothetical protein
VPDLITIVPEPRQIDGNQQVLAKWAQSDLPSLCGLYSLFAAIHHNSYDTGMTLPGRRSWLVIFLSTPLRGPLGRSASTLGTDHSATRQRGGSGRAVPRRNDCALPFLGDKSLSQVWSTATAITLVRGSNRSRSGRFILEIFHQPNIGIQVPFTNRQVAAIR